MSKAEQYTRKGVLSWYRPNNGKPPSTDAKWYTREGVLRWYSPNNGKK